MIFVVLLIFLEDQNVVEIDNHEMIKEFMENIIHKMLEDCRRIGKTERYDIVFKVSIPCLECNLPFVACLDTDQIISSSKVDFSVDLFLTELIKKS